MSSEFITLNRARTTFQRLCDARLFHGWIKEITPQVVTAQICTASEFHAGDQFLFHVSGPGQDAHFEAELVTFQGAGQGPWFVVDRGEDAVPIEVSCRITTEITLSKSETRERFWVHDMRADVLFSDGRHIRGTQVVDVGETGFALVTERVLSKGELLYVALFWNGQIIYCEAEVKNVVDSPRQPDLQRAGMHIRRMDRVNATRWSQLYEGLLRKNRMEGQYRISRQGAETKIKPLRAA